MKILLHICCAPCLAYPLEILESADVDVTGYFVNNNIHPYTEFKKRLDTLREFSENKGFNFICDEDYDIEEFFRLIAFNEERRCEICYLMRLESTVKMASEKGYDAFSTTLLYSKYQNHDLIREISLELSEKYGILFHYEDFRTGWGRGIKLSKKAGMYRQQYCGCIYSERDRFLKTD